MKWRYEFPNADVQGSEFQVAEDDADPLARFIFRNSDGLSELQTYADELTGVPATAFAWAQGAQVAANIRADGRQVRLARSRVSVQPI
jgi:hypothetical protein